VFDGDTGSEPGKDGLSTRPWESGEREREREREKFIDNQIDD
jgi:hypothetical protein